MKKIILLLLCALMLLMVTSCEVFELLFLPQDTSSELTSATYIDSTHFYLEGKGVNWNGLNFEILDNIKIFITTRDKNKVYKAIDITNAGCKNNQYKLTLEVSLNPGDHVYISGQDNIWGGVEFTVPGGA